MTSRPSGRRGLKPSADHPELMLSRFRTSPPKTNPPSADVTSGITDWGMLGNDVYGDCGPAATGHYRMAKAEGVLSTVTTAATEALYFAYGTAQGEPGPDPDEGVDNASWLQWLFQQGHIEAYAKVEHWNSTEVHRAMIDFKGVLVGCTLTDSAETEFENHEPWNVTASEPLDPDDGHDVLLVKYDWTSTQAQDTFVTWGALQTATVAWDSHAISEAWVIITSDDATRAGVNMAALQAEIRGLGGTT